MSGTVMELSAMLVARITLKERILEWILAQLEWNRDAHGVELGHKPTFLFPISGFRNTLYCCSPEIEE